MGGVLDFNLLEKNYSVLNTYLCMVNITHRERKVNKAIIMISENLYANFKLIHPLICLITFYMLPVVMVRNRINHWDHAYFSLIATTQLLHSELMLTKYRRFMEQQKKRIDLFFMVTPFSPIISM